MKTENRYIFTSERLSFRPYTLEDFDNLLKLDGDPEIRKFFPEGALNKKQIKENMERIIELYNKNGFGFMIIEDSSNCEFIGQCGFNPFEHTPDAVEIGFVLLKKHWGKGIATEVVKALLKYAELNLKGKIVIARTLPENTASQCVLEKCGMRFLEKKKFNDIEFIVFQNFLVC